MHLQTPPCARFRWHYRENCVLSVRGNSLTHTTMSGSREHLCRVGLFVVTSGLSVTLINQQWLRSIKSEGFCDIIQWKNLCLRHWGIMCRLYYGCNFNLLTAIICHHISVGVHTQLIVMLCFYRYVLEKSISIY